MEILRIQCAPKGSVKIQIYRRIREGDYLIRYVGYKKIALKFRENFVQKEQRKFSRFEEAREYPIQQVFILPK